MIDDYKLKITISLLVYTYRYFSALRVSPYMAEIFSYHGNQRFEIIIVNVLVRYFCFIWIPILWGCTIYNILVLSDSDVKSQSQRCRGYKGFQHGDVLVMFSEPAVGIWITRLNEALGQRRNNSGPNKHQS